MNNNFLPYQLKKNAEQANTLATQMAQITQQNNHTVSYGYDSNGNIQTVTEKDSSNNVIQTVTYTYNAAGDVATSATVTNGKTYTTTYNYDSNGNITSTSNAIS
jgi:YD repeat-containing protein